MFFARHSPTKLKSLTQIISVSLCFISITSDTLNFQQTDPAISVEGLAADHGETQTRTHPAEVCVKLKSIACSVQPFLEKINI